MTILYALGSNCFMFPLIIDLFPCIISDKFEDIKETIYLYPERLQDKQAGDYTLYHLAAACNRPLILQYLIEMDSSRVNDFDVDNETPLHQVSTFDSLERIEILLSYQANWRLQNQQGATAYEKARNSITRNVFKKYIKDDIY